MFRHALGKPSLDSRLVHVFSVLRQIAAPVLNDDIRNAVSVFEPESEETLLLNDVQLYEIRHPPFAAECPPLPPHIAPALREDDAHVHTLRTDRLYVL